MAEDSGAFKTNPAKSRQIRHFVISQLHRCSQASPAMETLCGRSTGTIPRICNQRCDAPYGILKPA
jgi:hypothetical protein